MLRKPTLADAEAVFARYASDVDVTRYVGWPRHQSVEDSEVFLRFSEAEWDKWPAGPYLIESRLDQQLLGGTGFAFESPTVATTGYVLAKDSWGRGYATETLMAMVNIAQEMQLGQLYALCHPDNAASIRVLNKCNFELARQGPDQALEFPNLNPGSREHCLRYVWQVPS